jgi:hypothetical protein
MAVELGEGEGRPSRWNTLRALRVLDWYSAPDESKHHEFNHKKSSNHFEKGY